MIVVIINDISMTVYKLKKTANYQKHQVTLADFIH